MKRLWRIIHREMQRDSLSAAQMAARLGMDPAHFSRLRTGLLRDLSAGALGRLLSGFPAGRHVEIQAAYLADKLEGAGVTDPPSLSKAVRVREEAPAYGEDIVEAACIRLGINRRVAAALGSLAKGSVGNRRLQALIVSLAGFARKN